MFPALAKINEEDATWVSKILNQDSVLLRTKNFKKIINKQNKTKAANENLRKRERQLTDQRLLKEGKMKL